MRKIDTTDELLKQLFPLLSTATDVQLAKIYEFARELLL